MNYKQALAYFRNFDTTPYCDSELDQAISKAIDALSEHLSMSKTIDQLIDDKQHLVEFIYPCQQGQTLVRWFTDFNTLKTQCLLPKDSADWVKQGLLRGGYHQT